MIVGKIFKLKDFFSSSMHIKPAEVRNVCNVRSNKNMQNHENSEELVLFLIKNNEINVFIYFICVC